MLLHKDLCIPTPVTNHPGTFCCPGWLRLSWPCCSCVWPGAERRPKPIEIVGMQKSLLVLATLGWAIAGCSDNLAPTEVESSPPAADPGFVAADKGRRPDVTGRFIVILAERSTPAEV